MLDDNGHDGSGGSVTVTVRELLELQDAVGNRLQTAVLWMRDLLNLSPEVAEHPGVISAVDGSTHHAQAAAEVVRQFVRRLTGDESPNEGES